MNKKQLIDFAEAIIKDYDSEGRSKNVFVWRYGIVELAKKYLQNLEEIEEILERDE